MIEFCIYEDDVVVYAKVHTRTCRHYINRKPQTQSNNRWHHGPYKTIELAYDIAKSLKGRLNTSGCPTCGTVGDIERLAGRK